MTTSDLPSLRYPEWQRPYQAALLEGDPKKLAEHVWEAEAAIFQRLQKLNTSQDGRAERDAIQDALNGLKVLKRDMLEFPDWESDSRAS